MEILFIDENVLVVNKPAGLAVLPDGWDPATPFLTHILEQEHGRVWTVHRIDKVTSGVLVFARNPETHRDLSLQFERHEVVKLYHAVAIGVPAWEDRVAAHPLRSGVGHRHRTIVDTEYGKSAKTHFHVMRRGANHALLQAEPTTGRTHQIRAHAYALGFPLLGDPLYGAGPSPLIDRPALHACSLRFRYAAGKSIEPLAAGAELVTFEAPYPADFLAVLDQLFA